MKRIALLVFLCATFLAPAQALAGNVVLKVEAHAHLIAVNRGATVKLVHVRSTAHLRVGQRVGLRLRRLANGTFASSHVKVLGRTTKTHFGGIALSSSAGRLTVSAGGAVLNMSTSSGTPATPGSDVEIDADLDNGGIAATQVSVASASAPGGSIEGSLTLGTTTATVTSDEMALVLNLPAGFDLSPFSDGQEVLATFAQQPDGTLLLVSLAGDDGSAEANDPTAHSRDDGQGDHGGGGSGGEGDG